MDERAPTALDAAVLAGGTLAYGIAAQRVIPERWHVPANVAAALASVMVGRRAGVSAADCGLGGGTVRRGLSTGSAAAVVVSAGIVAISVPDHVRALFSDERITGHGRGRAVYEVLVRIPVGTALAEEVLFRGALLGVMLRRHAAPASVALVSLCFGAWHVPPTMASLRSAALGRGARGRVGATASVAAVVAVTAAAGAGFAALRLRSGSVIAPALAHMSVNATSYLVARSAGR